MHKKKILPNLSSTSFFNRKDAEMKRDLAALPERRRRTFLRYMENLQKGDN